MVEPLALQAVLLGYQLNTILEPHLTRVRYSFRMVMFMTEEIVNEGLFIFMVGVWISGASG